MAQIDPMMGLRLWTQGQDPYDHDQLATNFSKLALHDHTPGRGVQIPSEGIFDGAITYAKMARTSIQAATQAIPSVGLNSTVSVTVTWGAAFADANYVLSEAVQAPAGQQVHVICTAKTATTATFEVRNNAGATMTTGILNVVAVHP